MTSFMEWFAVIMQILPTIERAMTTIAADTGKPLSTTVVDVINHLTPGMPNSPSLKG